MAEFFSGIGGMHYALQRVLPEDWELHVQAYDINALANQTYMHNFAGCRPRTYDLHSITAQMLDDLRADLWCLSPPCQPYTRTLNAQQRDVSDPRAKSLLRILQELPQMAQPPALLLLENVEGFAGGQVHELLKTTLASCSYHLQEFMVSPHQLGIPYLRSRYFALASLQPLRCNSYDGHIVRHPPTLKQHEVQVALSNPLLPVDHALHLSRWLSGDEHHCQQAASTRDWGGEHEAATDGVAWVVMSSSKCAAGAAEAGPEFSSSKPKSPSAPLAQDLPMPALTQAALMPGGAVAARLPSEFQWPPCSFAGEEDIRPITQQCLPLEHFLAYDGHYDEDVTDVTKLWEEYNVPLPVMAKFWRSYDVVTGASTHSNCITKNYSRTGVAAGSMVASPAFVDSLCRVDSRGRVHMQQNPIPRCEASIASQQIKGQGHACSDVEGVGSSKNSGESSDSSRLCAPSQVEHSSKPEPCSYQGGGSSGEGGRNERGADDPAAVATQQELLPASLLRQLRYLTPREVANLHGFPEATGQPRGFGLPPGVTARQAYGLLGNSLSVDVVAWLLLYLLTQRLAAGSASRPEESRAAAATLRG